MHNLLRISILILLFLTSCESTEPCEVCSESTLKVRNLLVFNDNLDRVIDHSFKNSSSLLDILQLESDLFRIARVNDKINIYDQNEIIIYSVPVENYQISIDYSGAFYGDRYFNFLVLNSEIYFFDLTNNNSGYCDFIKLNTKTKIIKKYQLPFELYHDLYLIENQIYFTFNNNKHTDAENLSRFSYNIEADSIEFNRAESRLKNFYTNRLNDMLIFNKISGGLEVIDIQNNSINLTNEYNVSIGNSLLFTCSENKIYSNIIINGNYKNDISEFDPLNETLPTGFDLPEYVESIRGIYAAGEYIFVNYYTDKETRSFSDDSNILAVNINTGEVNTMLGGVCGKLCKKPYINGVQYIDGKYYVYGRFSGAILD